ncbi:MAG: serine/threonine protein kinase, partial [Planctomycetes bacterium]|nr:serine/threonine protein kinase [Planctomycetota bacterium]
MKTRCARCDYVFDSQEAPGLEAACPQCLAASVAALPEDDLLKPGAMFRGLEIKGPLGRGGMGVVYKARQIELGRIVALKVLDPRLAGDPDFIQRFGREARALAALDRPHIVRIHEFGREGDQLFLTMEYVDGVSLRALMRERRLTPAEALAIVPQICEGLECAHSMGVIHRDIKPENILVDREGRVKIADFGLAKMLRQDDAVATRTHITMGTPAYMAPEQYESLKGVDHRADIYALGVVFYEMLTGELPVGRFDPPSVRVQVDVRLDEIVLKALEKRLDRRYQRAAEVKTDLETVASGCARRVVVGRKGVAVMAVTLCLLGVLGVFVPWGQEDPASRIDRVLARLGGGDLEEREAASKELIEMGVGDRGVLARLEKLRDGATAPEARGRLEGVIREVDYEAARRVRLVPQSWIHGHGQ